MNKWFVYILTNKSHTVLYTGVTSDINKRVNQHKTWTYDWFSKRYNLKKIVWYDTFNNIEEAIIREKKIKKRNVKKKILLISKINPQWHDLLI